MAPRTWHGPEHQAFFMKWMPIYICRQSERRLYKFWGPMFQDWFEQFPEQAFLDFPLPGDPDAPPLTEEMRNTLGTAISKRKQRLENYFRNNRAKLDAGATKRMRSEYALARSLFKAKPTRKRLHKPVEIFQLRNNTLIREECKREGHDTINEESMAAAVVDWVNEDDTVQLARIKDAQAARMRLRTRVVNALFAEAEEEELAAIAEVLEREKAGEIVSGDDADDGYPARAPAEYQASIDESWDVMKKVHKALEKMTGWYGFSMWGGPNPRIGGELSMKSVSFGFSPAGLDFEGSHSDFEKAVSVPFQLFLRRCFPPELRITRSLDILTGEGSGENKDESTIDPLFRLPNEDAEPRKRPKRMVKSKKSSPAKITSSATSTTASAVPAASTSTVALPPIITPVIDVAPTSAPTDASIAPGIEIFISDFITAAQDPHIDTTMPSTDNYDAPPVPRSPHGPQTEGPDFDSDIFMGMDDLLGSDDFGIEDLGAGDSADTNDMGMPPLPSERAGWEASFPEGGGFRPAMEPLANSQARMSSLFEEYRRRTQDSPTRSREGLRLMSTSAIPSPTRDCSVHSSVDVSTSSSIPGPRETSSSSTTLSLGSSPVPARFRRHDEGAERLPSPPNLIPLKSLSMFMPPSILTPPSATPVSTLRRPLLAQSRPSANPIPLKSLSQATPPSVVPISTPDGPVLPQSRPPANVPQPAPAAKGRGGRKKKIEGAEGKAKTAAKVAGKKGVTTGKRQKAAVAAEDLEDAASAAGAEEAVLADASNTLIYTSTNNSIKLDKELKARRAAATAAKAPAVPNRLHNPDGPTDLVIVPAPARPRRERHAPMNADNTAVALPVKRTLAQMREANNFKTENALLARTGRLPVATSSAGTKR